MTPRRDAAGRTINGLDVLIGILSRRSSHVLSRHFESINLQPRFYAVMRLIKSERLNQITIAERLKLNKNVMVKLIDEMEKQGLCRRVQKPKSRRREYYIQLTDEGRRKLQASAELARKAQEEILRSLSDREKNTLLHLLSKLIKHQSQQ